MHREQASEDLLQQTIALWQSRHGETLTREDAREIAANVSGFFQILIRWDRNARAIDPGGAAQWNALANGGMEIPSER